MTPGKGGTLHVVRHAKAGSRKRFAGEDRLRPLSDEGWGQAEAIADRFEGPPAVAVGQVVSSPAVRCTETVSPLARRRGIETDVLDELGEGTDPLVALARLLELVGVSPHVVACTHGDVALGMLETLVAASVDVDGPLAWPKAATWDLEVVCGSVVSARYVPPPPGEP